MGKLGRRWSKDPHMQLEGKFWRSNSPALWLQSAILYHPLPRLLKDWIINVFNPQNK